MFEVSLRATAMGVLLLACSAPHVISPYGDAFAVSPNSDGSPRRRQILHDGVDFGPAHQGDDVIASADGVVMWTWFDGSAGIEIRIRHTVALDKASKGASYVTSYAHLRKATVRAGERVTRGEKIGEVGLFWASGGVVHVHWRLCQVDCDETLDPVPRTAGCYEPGKRVAEDTLVLTYPLRC